MRRSLILVGVLTLLAIIILSSYTYKTREDSPPPFNSVATDAKYLWAQETRNIDLWQMIAWPTSIVSGPENQLFVSNSNIGGIIRMTVEGHMIEIIGQQGHGPGEFIQPVDLFYQSGQSVLWVVDKNQMRISIFLVGQSSSELLDVFPSPQVIHSSIPTLVVRDSNHFWYVDNSRSIGEKVLLINSYGETIKSMDTHWSTAKPTRPNPDGYIYLVPGGVNGELIVVWPTFPMIQFLDEIGVIRYEQEIITPEIERNHQISQDSESYRMHLTHASYYQETNSLFVMVMGPPAGAIYEFAIPGFDVVKRYVLPLYDPQLLLSVFTVVRSETLIFYAYDMKTSGLVEIIAIGSVIESSAMIEEFHWCKCPGNGLPVGCGEAECPPRYMWSGSGICGGKQGDCWNGAMPIDFKRFDCPENLEVCGSIQ